MQKSERVLRYAKLVCIQVLHVNGCAEPLCPAAVDMFIPRSMRLYGDKTLDGGGEVVVVEVEVAP